jgi:ureidoacrylate peracid hydrolase
MQGGNMPLHNEAVLIDARPEPVSADLACTAVLVVDMQNDFGSKGGMFDTAGIDISVIRRAVEPTARVLAAARECKLPIVYLAMQHRADLADMGDEAAPHRIKHRPMRVGESVTSPDGQPSRILVEGGWGTSILPELRPKGGDVVVPKHRYSGFFETQLDSVLRGLGVQNLIVTGCTTSVCVESTVRDAMFRDYRCVVLEDCTAEPIGASNTRGNHEASLLTIELLLGWVSSSSKFIAALNI